MRDISVTFTGNVASPPTFVGGTHRGGDGTVLFRVAANPTWFDRTRGEWAQKDSVFFSVFVRGQQADNVYDSIHQGEPVYVTGRLSTSEYALKGTGEVVKGNTVNADAVGHALIFGTSKFTKVTREAPAAEAQSGEAPDLGATRPDTIVAPAGGEAAALVGTSVGAPEADASEPASEEPPF